MSEQTSTTPAELPCEQCRDLLSDYVDRELTGEEKAAVERHLGNCAKCGTESSRMQGLKKIAQHWGGVRGSGEFRKSVMQKMIRESQQVPASQFTDAAAKSGDATAEPITNGNGKSLPPIWILLVAGVLATLAYLLVKWLRGL